MRILALLSLLLLPILDAQARTQVIFSRDGTTATVLLAGLPGDADPFGFYNALKVPAEDFQGKWSKKISLAGPGGAKAFDAACIFSKVMPDNGSCTLIFRASEGAIDINRDTGKATLWLSGLAAQQFADFFVTSEISNIVFRSTDGRLNISLLRTRDGTVSDFVADWKGVGF